MNKKKLRKILLRSGEIEEENFLVAEYMEPFDYAAMEV